MSTSTRAFAVGSHIHEITDFARFIREAASKPDRPSAVAPHPFRTLYLADLNQAFALIVALVLFAVPDWNQILLLCSPTLGRGYGFCHRARCGHASPFSAARLPEPSRPGPAIRVQT